MRENLESGSVRELIITSVLLLRQEVRYELYSTKKYRKVYIYPFSFLKGTDDMTKKGDKEMGIWGLIVTSAVLRMHLTKRGAGASWENEAGKSIGLYLYV
jgi:hypothetical protein